ncbi:PHP domain-containing protein [Streptomyces aidingensis]|uniref:PHP domain-containing protein n=1 Tax=Streptomyces aidingensis TaxID=910347 RepID=UPI001114CF68|nr:hypothetical protein [Streptomyces aidingensis]
MIALADHNTGDWLDDMKVAGERHGVIVFPGVEVTTGSGSDGVHLLLIGELDRSKHDIDLMLAQTCGFNEDHPRLNPKLGILPRRHIRSRKFSTIFQRVGLQLHRTH